MERVPVRGNEGTPPFLFTLVKVKGERISLPTKWKDERRFLIIYSDVLLEFSRRSLFFSSRESVRTLSVYFSSSLRLNITVEYHTTFFSYFYLFQESRPEGRFYPRCPEVNPVPSGYF